MVKNMWLRLAALTLSVLLTANGFSCFGAGGGTGTIEGSGDLDGVVVVD